MVCLLSAEKSCALPRSLRGAVAMAVDGELEEWVCGLPVGFVAELGRARLVNVVHGNPDSLSGWALGARNHPVAPSDPLREATTHLVA